MTELAIANQTEEQEPRFMFQFIEGKTGRRTDPFVTDWDELATVLVKAEKDYVEEFIRAGEPEEYPDLFPGKDDLILLVAVVQGKQTKIPSNPLITVKTFLEAHGEINDE